MLRKIFAKGTSEKYERFAGPLCELQEVVAPSYAIPIIIQLSDRAHSKKAIKLTRSHISLTSGVDMVFLLK